MCVVQTFVFYQKIRHSKDMCVFSYSDNRSLKSILVLVCCLLVVSSLSAVPKGETKKRTDNALMILPRLSPSSSKMETWSTHVLDTKITSSSMPWEIVDQNHLHDRTCVESGWTCHERYAKPADPHVFTSRRLDDFPNIYMHEILSEFRTSVSKTRMSYSMETKKAGQNPKRSW